MPDSKAGTWAALNGKEFINAQRTISYINNFGLPIKIDADCWCANIHDLLDDCPDEPVGTRDPNRHYTFPSHDPAPWYDPAIPDSGDFLGFLVTEFEGLGSTYTRETFDTISGGAVLGRLRPLPRTLTWRGFLFGRTCCATQYGLRWLTAQMASSGGCDGCDGSSLDILICCPEPVGSPPTTNCSTVEEVVATCGLEEPLNLGPIPPLAVPLDNEDAFRTFFRVGLIDGPVEISQRTLGCGGDCEDGPGCLIEVEFSMVAGNPFMHKDPVIVCGPENFPSCDSPCVEWIKVTSAEECENLLDCGATPVDCVNDPTCPRADLPELPKLTDDCGCEALSEARLCCAVSNDIYGQFFEGVPQFNIFSGSQPLQNVTIRIYENPQERTCDDEALFDICNLCASVTVRYIPAYSTLKIDGLTKQISIECVGNNIQPAESLTTAPFSWPTFKCIDYIVTVSADCCSRTVPDPNCENGIAPDASVTLCVIPREM